MGLKMCVTKPKGDRELERPLKFSRVRNLNFFHISSQLSISKTAISILTGHALCIKEIAGESFKFIIVVYDIQENRHGVEDFGGWCL